MPAPWCLLPHASPEQACPTPACLLPASRCEDSDSRVSCGLPRCPPCLASLAVGVGDDPFLLPQYFLATQLCPAHSSLYLVLGSHCASPAGPWSQGHMGGERQHCGEDMAVGPGELPPCPSAAPPPGSRAITSPSAGVPVLGGHLVQKHLNPCGVAPLESWPPGLPGLVASFLGQNNCLQPVCSVPAEPRHLRFRASDVRCPWTAVACCEDAPSGSI